MRNKEKYVGVSVEKGFQLSYVPPPYETLSRDKKVRGKNEYLGVDK